MYNRVSFSRVIALLILSLLVVYCQENEYSTLYNELELSLNNGDSTLVILSTAPIPRMRRKEYLRYYSRVTRSDPYHPINRFLYYSCGLDLEQELMLIIKDGSVFRIDPYNKSFLHRIETNKDEVINWRIQANIAISNNNIHMCSSLVNYTGSSFYDYYLLANMYSIMMNNSENTHFKYLAKLDYESNPSPIYTPLYYEILESADITDIELPQELNRIITFGEVLQGQIAKCDIVFNNVNSKDFLVFQSLVSCRCLSVKCTNNTPSNSSGVLHVEYNTSDNIKGLHKNSITLITNTRQRTITIPVVLTVT